MPDPIVLVVRKDDMPDPPVESDEVDCGECGKPCWLSLSTKHGLEGQGTGYRPRCVFCMKGQLEEHSDSLQTPDQGGS